MFAIITLILIVLFFVCVALLSRPDCDDSDGFYRMKRLATRSDYGVSTVAYSLQTAVTVYFIYWGFQYGVANIGFVLTWMMGLLLFSYLVKRIALHIPTFNTLIALIANSSKALKFTSVVLNLGVIIGLIYSELFFASSFFGAASSGAQTGNTYAAHFWIIFIFLAVSALVYVSYGGVRKVIQTDYYQLAIAYISYGVLLACFLPAVAEQSVVTCRVLASVAGGCFLLIACSTAISKLHLPRTLPDKAALLSGILLLIVGFVFASGATGNLKLADTVPGLSSMFLNPGGFAPLVSFGLANLLWQFSDYTAYQRLSTLPVDSNQSTHVQALRKAIHATALASPITWSLGIILGVALRGTGWIPLDTPDVFGAFVAILTQSQGGVWLAAQVALAAFLVGVLLSTVDGAFLAGSQIIEEDYSGQTLTPRTRRLVLAGLGLSTVLMAFFHIFLNVNILSKLSFIYSMGLVFAAPMLAILFGNRPQPWFSIVALVVSVGAGLWGLVSPPEWPPLVKMVLPQFAAMITSLFLFLVIGRFFPHKISV